MDRAVFFKPFFMYDFVAPHPLHNAITPPVTKIYRFVIPFLQMRKLRPREVK